MRRTFLYVVVLVVLLPLPSCSHKSGSNIKVVKPKYHHRWYDRKKDRHSKRTKSLKVKN